MSTFSLRERWVFVAAGLAGFAFVYIFICVPWDLDKGFFVGTPVARDFVNFWMGGHLALIGDLDLLIDRQNYMLLISRTFGHSPEDPFVFSYPPHILLFFVPFALLPFAPSAWIWTGVNFFCVYRSAQLIKAEPALAVVACLSPAVLIMAAYGHFGGVLGLLAIYILTRGHDRPAVAGACLAVMTVKPQFAAVLGLFLLLTGYWRAVLFAIPFTVALIGASLLAFGVKPWINFFQWTMPFHARLISEFLFHALRTTITPYLGAGMIGLPPWAAQAIHAAVGIPALGGAIFVLIKRGVTPRTIALGLFAVILVLPYSNAYDLAMIAAPLTLAFFAERPGDDRLFLPFIPAFLLWFLPPFAWYFGVVLWPVAPVVFAAAFMLALARESFAVLGMDHVQWDGSGAAAQSAVPSSAGRPQRIARSTEEFSQISAG